MFQKRLLLTAICATMMIPPSSIAQDGALATPFIGANGNGGAFVGTAGDYNIDNVTQSNTEIIGQVVGMIQGVQQQDRDY
ncbi:MAG: hypothetical protein HRT45_06750 [Bdellovibrionales bacterium]|nr:hypothetical protein [Bdellovibrionales bacterium]